MSDLTEEQRRFLIYHRISPNSVFDASGMSHDEWRLEMKNEEKLFAMGVSPCKKFGHTLRDRSNHCIQCDTKNIRFIERYFEGGYIYVSASSTLRMLKVGCSKDPVARERTINGFAYAGASDWGKIAHLKCKHAGKVEFDIHSKLSQYLSPQSYFANGRETRCREIFSCGYGIVRNTIADVVGQELAKNIWEVQNASLRFNF
jgi:T5orf172 domain